MLYLKLLSFLFFQERWGKNEQKREKKLFLVISRPFAGLGLPLQSEKGINIEK